MLKRDQELIDQFNAEEHRNHQRQLRKVKRRLRLPSLGEWRHLILDQRDETRERRRPADCVSHKWIGGNNE